MMQRIRMFRPCVNCMREARYNLDPLHHGDVDYVVLIGENGRSACTRLSHMSMNTMLMVFAAHTFFLLFQIELCSCGSSFYLIVEWIDYLACQNNISHTHVYCCVIELHLSSSAMASQPSSNPFGIGADNTGQAGLAQVGLQDSQFRQAATEVIHQLGSNAPKV